MSTGLHLGDCLDVLPTLEAESVDSIITDPPYGLAFMGKEWDHGVPGVPFWEQCLRVAKPGAMLLAFGGTRTHHRLMCAIEDAGWEIRDCLMWLQGQGFPKGHDCSKAIRGIGHREFLTGAFHSIRTGASYQCGCSENCRQCGVSLHAGKGNGQDAVPLLADALVRNHLFETLTQTLEDIGHSCTSFSCGLFAHLSKLDCRGRKAADAWRLVLAAASCLCPLCFERLVRGASDDAKHQGGIDWSSIDALSVVSAWEKSEILYRILDISPQPYSHYNTEAEKWQGWNAALKPAWEPIILAMKPLPGTFAQNALDYGVAGVWVDGTRVATNGAEIEQGRGNRDARDTGVYGKYEGQEERVFQSKGRWPANLVLSHTAECRRVGVKRVKGAGWREADRKHETPSPEGFGGKRLGNAPMTYTDPDGYETVEKWECAEDCPVRLLDEQSGERPTGPGGITRKSNGHGSYGSHRTRETIGYADTGGASRFFYTAKASRSEREAGLIGHLPCIKCGGLDTETHTDPKSGREVKCRRNGHPTVKPLELCRWLCRLTKTPTGGVVLDPFMGSGSIPLAAVLEGRDPIGIESERESFEVAQVRIEQAQPEPIQMRMI